MSFLDNAIRVVQQYTFGEGHNPDPKSYADETLNDIIAYNEIQGWFNIYKGARHDFRGIFQCFDEFKYKHIKELDEYNGDLGDLLLNYCGHNNLFRRNCDKLPGLVATGREIVAKLLQDEKFKQFCNNIKPFNHDHSGVHINYRKRNFKVALFMHDNLASFMNALFVDTSPIIDQIEEYTRPIKCWLSMFFSEETFSKLKLLKKQSFLDYPYTIVEKVITAMKSRGFASSVESSDSSHSRGRIRSRSPSPSRGGARKRTARVPRKQRKQCKSRKQRK
jgi:hypothetical protein